MTASSSMTMTFRSEPAQAKVRRRKPPDRPLRRRPLSGGGGA